MEMEKISGSFQYVNHNSEFRWKPYIYTIKMRLVPRPKLLCKVDPGCKLLLRVVPGPKLLLREVSELILLYRIDLGTLPLQRPRLG